MEPDERYWLTKSRRELFKYRHSVQLETVQKGEGFGKDGWLCPVALFAG